MDRARGSVRKMMEKSDKTKMNGLLEKMLKSTEARDKKEVLKLNRLIEPLIVKEYKIHNSQLIRDYDNCRQSCILSFTFPSGPYYPMIADAKKRFSKIKKAY